eukprot:1154464-Pelagomonas_calceolata.AAC.1
MHLDTRIFPLPFSTMRLAPPPLKSPVNEEHVSIRIWNQSSCCRFELRQKYASLFEHNFSFLRLHVTHRMPCLGTIHHGAGNSQDIKNFLNQASSQLSQAMCENEELMSRCKL